jgi:cyclopropane fatty-acyl-phospholipid synthase-like methyltransferase
MKASQLMAGDVPSPIDFDNVEEVLAWIKETEFKRPWRADFFAAFAKQIAEYLPSAATILELGAGPGMLAEQILSTCSVRRYVLLDFSLPMHRLAQQRLKAFDGITEYCKKDFRVDNWERGLGTFDACVTMQAAHEVRHKEHAPQLLRRIMATIRPEGYLWYADHYLTTQNNPDLFFTVSEQPDVLRAAGYSDVTLILDKGNMALYRGCKPRSD